MIKTMPPKHLPIDERHPVGHAPMMLAQASAMVSRAPVLLTDVLAEEFDALYRFARRMGLAEADTEDALQEVALVCAQKSSAEVENGRAYLFGITYKVASRLRERKRKHDPTEPLEDIVIADPHASPEEALQEREARRLLDAILDSLPDDERAVLILCDIEEQTMAEVASELGLPPGTVASRLRRARESFVAARTRLEGRVRS